MLSKEFWDRWTKHHVPYKVNIYLCGCSYILITDTDRRILTKHSFCPVHKVGKKYILLWCEVCGLRIEAAPQAGYRQKRCFDCGKAFLLEYNRLNWKAKYGGRYKSKPKKQKTELQEFNEEEATQKDVAYLAVARFIKSMDRELPVVLTPLLDEVVN